MRAVLRRIQPHDLALDWDAFVSADRPEWLVKEGYGGFTLEIGSDTEAGADLFDVIMTTKPYAGRARDRREPCGPFIVVEAFSPDVIEATLRRLVGEAEGREWSDVVRRIRSWARWEYEGMDPVL